jgi:hypothetical protein
MCGLKPAIDSFPFTYLSSACSSSRFFSKRAYLTFRFRLCEVCITRTGGGVRMGLQQARRSLAAARRAGQTGPILIWLTLFGRTVVFVLVFLGFVVLAVAVASSVFEPVAAAGNSDDLGVMKEPIQDRRGRGDITE